MSNTLTYIQRQAFEAMAEVAAEQAGAVMSVNTTFGGKQVAAGEYVDVPLAPVATMTTFTPSNVYPSPSDQTASRVRLQIVSPTLKTTPRYLTGEEIQSLKNAGNDLTWAKDNIKQMCRAMRNAIETALCNIIKAGSSRATGTAGTTPFSSDLSQLVDAKKILIDNGAPLSDLQCVINSSAYTNMSKLGIIQQYSLAGSDEERRTGVIGKQFGAQIRLSAGLAAHTIGTPSGTLMSATEPVGETSLAYDGDTNGPWTAGDVVTLGSGGGSGTADTAKYIVSAANTATPLVINKPGLLLEHVDNDTMTVGASYTPNFLFERNAVGLVVRPTFIPPNPTINQLPITDPISGLTYVLCEVSEYGQLVWELHAAYGGCVFNPEFVATILG